MYIKKILLPVILYFFLLTIVHAQDQPLPYGLTVNLLSQTDQVHLNGYPATTPIEKAISQRENFQFIEISTLKPFFGWVVPSGKANTLQTAYRLLVASDKNFLLKDLLICGTPEKWTGVVRLTFCITDNNWSRKKSISGK